jgi:hypothetical protein
MEDRSPVVPYNAERFELRGQGIDVTYEQVPGNAALRHMTVTEDSHELRRYLGGEIQLEHTNIGTMVTVVSGFAYDGDTRKLSVLLPGVNLTRSQTAEVATVAIRTVDKGSLGGPTLIDGALAKYQSIPLTGAASRGRE